MRHVREIFDDWLTRLAGIILVLIVGLVMFNTFSGITHNHPLIGLVTFSLEPFLFVIGGVVYVFAIRRI
jgi:hypothetical protein